MSASNLITAEELIERLTEPGLRVIDARFELGDPQYGAAAYAAGHVPGAVYLDLDADLSGPLGTHGGRHPLPHPAELAVKLGALGVSRQNPVVVYDQSGSMYAARAWWLLRYLGHDDVRFLDGGLAAYLAAGGALVQAAAAPQSTTFEVALRPAMLVDAHHVDRVRGSGSVVLMDARAGERYRGEVEPLDPKAGHVPGAINRFYQDALEGGRFRSREALREFVAPAASADEVIAYCGSGVSGAHLVLTLAEAGFPNAKLYAGSWSDWTSYDHLPVATGNEE